MRRRTGARFRLGGLLVAGICVIVCGGCAGSPSESHADPAITPSIAAEPANQTVRAGQSATFFVVASGTPPPSYQWLKNGLDISGAQAASYVTPATTAADNGSIFDVVVSNSVGSVTSSSAELTVNPMPVPPSITIQPANQRVTAGESATFSVVASGTAPLSYQWQKNGANISSGNAASYTTPATASADNGSTFDVVVSNSVGSVTSSSAELTVNPMPAPPSITIQPANQTVTAGESATFSVVASGTAPLSYQWQKNGANISGGNAASYTTPAAASADNGSAFDVIVSNSAGSVTSNTATLTVNSGFTGLTSLTLNPVTVPGGSPSTGTVTLNGVAPTGGAVVTLSSNSATAQVPASVTVAAGSTSVSFTVNTSSVSANTEATIDANYSGSTASAVLTVQPIVVSSVSVNPASVTGGMNSTGTVTLSGMAPTGGAVVTLSSNSTAAQVPVSVNVSAGQSSANFTITTSPVSSSTSVSITAGYSGSTASASLTLSATVPIPTSTWTLVSVDSQEVSCANNAATLSYDGNPSTFWHTQYCGNLAPLPHQIQIDLHGKYYIGALQYLPRQDGCSNGWINQYEFDVSTDASTWTAAATGGFDYTGYTTGTSTPTSCTGASAVPVRQVGVTPILGRYIQLRAFSEVNGNQYTSAAEIGVVSGCATTPSVLLNQPVTEYLQTTSTLTASATVCLGAPQAGWGAKFTLDGGSPVIVYSAPYQATFTGVSKAEHTIDVYLVDGSGNVQGGSSAHDQATQVAVGDFYVGYGDSITTGLDDDITSDNTSTDGRNTGGGYEPVLNNLRTSKKGYPQDVGNEGEPGNTSGDGAANIQTVLTRNPLAKTFLVMWGTNDSYNQRPSGLNLSPGQSGYSGSFKDDMQQIINAVVGAGKSIALAKIPPVLDDCNGTCAPYYDPNNISSRNQLIQQYNQVIVQLVSQNGITVTPPDFYTLFANNWQTLYANYIHPNGLGYQNMAQLWNNALP